MYPGLFQSPSRVRVARVRMAAHVWMAWTGMTVSVEAAGLGKTVMSVSKS